MNVFQFASYKTFLNTYIKLLPKKGRGQYRRIAQTLNIHTTMVSHVFKGVANLSVNQALQVCDLYGFSELETEYFVCLVQLERAGGHRSQMYFQSQLVKLREKSQEIKERLGHKNYLAEGDRARFYSEWYYSGVRLLTALDDYKDLGSIAEYFGLPNKLIREILEFLLGCGLVEKKDGKIHVGPTQTYVGNDTALVTRHHTNWRLKSLEQFRNMESDELAFTNPITLSKKDFDVVREAILKLIEEFQEISKPSNPELLCCLNIDWFKVK